MQANEPAGEAQRWHAQRTSEATLSLDPYFTQRIGVKVSAEEGQDLGHLAQGHACALRCNKALPTGSGLRDLAAQALVSADEPSREAHGFALQRACPGREGHAQ
jgi:hypothetical protein